MGTTTTSSAFKANIIRTILNVDGEGEYLVYDRKRECKYAKISLDGNTILYNGKRARLWQIRGLVKYGENTMLTMAYFNAHNSAVLTSIFVVNCKPIPFAITSIREKETFTTFL